MTLVQILVGGGVVLSVVAMLVLASYWPTGRRRALCLRTQVEEDCTSPCLRHCHLVVMGSRASLRVESAISNS